MRTRNTIIVLSVLSLTLWVSTQSVVGSKLLELQIYIEKDVIQNLELSSQVLERRFRRQILGEDDINTEIKYYALATQTLNEPEPELLEVSWLNRGGIAIVNSVRLLSFKPLIDLWKERKLLLLLKYAFYLERHRRTDESIKEYDTFLEQNDDSSSNAQAFALLHQAYCYLLIGNSKSSIKNIALILENSPGTHYAKTAAVLSQLIKQIQKQRRVIQEKYTEPQERARILFEARDFSAAKEVYKSIPKLSLPPMGAYRFARVKEETGQVKKATGEYKKIINKNTGTQAARLANRRLLLIGNLYGGGKSVQKYAESKAIQLGDALLVKSIRRIKARLPESIVPQESLKIKAVREEFGDNEDNEGLIDFAHSEENIDLAAKEIKAIEQKEGQDIFERFAKYISELVGGIIGVTVPAKGPAELKQKSASDPDAKISDSDSKQNTNDTEASLSLDLASNSPESPPRTETEDLDLGDTKLVDERDSNAADLFLLPSDEEGIRSGEIKLIPVTAPLTKKEEKQKEQTEINSKRTQVPSLFTALGKALDGALEMDTPSPEVSPAANTDEKEDKAAGFNTKEQTAPEAGIFDRIGSAVGGAFDTLITPSPEVSPAANTDEKGDKAAGFNTKDRQPPKLASLIE